MLSNKATYLNNGETLYDIKNLLDMNCSVCGKGSMRSVLSLGDIPLCDDIKNSRKDARLLTFYPMSVYECNSCKHCELSYKVDESIIYADYLYKSSDSLFLQHHFRDYFNYIASYFNKTDSDPLRCIDIGGNDGLFAKIFCDHGWEAHVLDPSPSINYCDRSITTHQGYLTETLAREISNMTGQFDLVVSNNCIANIRHLHSFVESLSILVKAGGILAIETGYLAEQVKNMAIEMVNHEHYHYFSIESMKQLLFQHGITLLKSSVNSSKGGCIRFIGMKSGASQHLPVVSNAKESHQIPNMETLCSDLIEKVYNRREYIKNKLSGKEVVAFGACAGSTILTYLYELQDVYNKIYDDNKVRHNKYMPGTGACISDTLNWYQSSGDICINLAWRYGDMIRKKHLPFLPENYSILDIHKTY